MRRPAMDPSEATAHLLLKNGMMGLGAGRVPSAMPVPRLRLPRMLGGLRGVAASVPPAYNALYIPQGLMTAGSMPLLTSGSKWYFVGTYPPAVGDVVVSMLGARQATITPPAGWTTLASGTVGDLSYWLGYRVATGSDTWTAGISPTWVNWATSGYAGYCDALTWCFDPTDLTPVAAVTTYDTTTALVPMKTPDPAWVGAWNAGLATRSVQATADPTSFSFLSPDIGSFGDIIAVVNGRDDAMGEADTLMATVGNVQQTSYACDMVMCAFGWV